MTQRKKTGCTKTLLTLPAARIFSTKQHRYAVRSTLSTSRISRWMTVPAAGADPVSCTKSYVDIFFIGDRGSIVRQIEHELFNLTVRCICDHETDSNTTAHESKIYISLRFRQLYRFWNEQVFEGNTISSLTYLGGESILELVNLQVNWRFSANSRLLFDPLPDTSASLGICSFTILSVFDLTLGETGSVLDSARIAFGRSGGNEKDPSPMLFANDCIFRPRPNTFEVSSSVEHKGVARPESSGASFPVASWSSDSCSLRSIAMFY